MSAWGWTWQKVRPKLTLTNFKFTPLLHLSICLILGNKLCKHKLAPNQTGLLWETYMKHNQGSYRTICLLGFTQTWGKTFEERSKDALVKTSVCKWWKLRFNWQQGNHERLEGCLETQGEDAAKTTTLSLVFVSLHVGAIASCADWLPSHG